MKKLTVVDKHHRDRMSASTVVIEMPFDWFMIKLRHMADNWHMTL